jgi:putative colanic acid biosynthesis glycosyltransferase
MLRSTTKLKILQVNTVCGVGSTGRIATGISEVCRKKGVKNYIAYGHGKTTFPYSYRIGKDFDHYTHNILSRLSCRQGNFSHRATIKFLTWVEEFQPDIIHLHNLHGNYINIDLLFNYIKSKKIPCVWTLHDCWSFTGKCVCFDYVDCYKWREGCYSCSQIKSYPKSLFLDNSKTEYQKKKNLFCSIDNLTVITPSRWLASLVKESYLGKYPVKVINNGIDLNIFKPVKSDWINKYNLENKFVVLGVASVWGERKGFKYFLRLAESLNDNQQVILVGLNEKQKNTIPSNIIGISRTNNTKELAEIYTTADVFVNPTLEDNFPTTNIESLACGTPVITFNTGGSSESIDDTCGIVVKKEDFLGLFNAIEYVRQQRPFNSEECIRRASKLYGQDDRYADYLAVYKQILN